jgi:hypothetical protein
MSLARRKEKRECHRGHNAHGLIVTRSIPVRTPRYAMDTSRCLMLIPSPARVYYAPGAPCDVIERGNVVIALQNPSAAAVQAGDMRRLAPKQPPRLLIFSPFDLGARCWHSRSPPPGLTQDQRPCG